jgi:hypothetical protein
MSTLGGVAEGRAAGRLDSGRPVCSFLVDQPAAGLTAGAVKG